MLPLPPLSCLWPLASCPLPSLKNSPTSEESLYPGPNAQRVQRSKAGQPSHRLRLRRLPRREAQFFNTRVGGSQLLDGHVEQGLTFSGLLLPNARTPAVKLVIAFEEQNNLSIMRNLVGKLWMLSEIAIEFHSQEAVSLFVDIHAIDCFPIARSHRRISEIES